MSNTINDISQNYTGVDYGFDYESYTDEEKSIALEDSLYSICNNLAEIEKITGNNKLNTEYLLTIMGSYVMGLQENTLNENTEPPSVLFTQSLFPSLNNPTTVEKEEVVYDNTDNSEAPIGYASSDPTN